jgi:hypothetical protein
VSANGRPDVAAFRELERHVRQLGDELAFFRRRALESERRARELGEALQSATRPPDAVDDGAAGEASLGPEARAERLGRENAELRAENARLTAESADARARLAEASERTRQLVERVRFLRQQQEASGER